jgi:hypothetical protein
MGCPALPRAPPGEGRSGAQSFIPGEVVLDLTRCPPLDRLRRSQDAPSVQKVNVSRKMFPNWPERGRRPAAGLPELAELRQLWRRTAHRTTSHWRHRPLNKALSVNHRS